MSFPEFQQQRNRDRDRRADRRRLEGTGALHHDLHDDSRKPSRSPSSRCFEAEQHFRKHYLPQLVKSGTDAGMQRPGEPRAAGSHVSAAVREAWEQESRFPQQIVNGLRPSSWKRACISSSIANASFTFRATKPLRHPAGQVFPTASRPFCNTVEASPRSSAAISPRRFSASSRRAGDRGAKGRARRRPALSDPSGHVIEFSDGALELPLVPGSGQAQGAPKSPVASATQPPLYRRKPPSIRRP